jgi:hypothetical protein
MARDVFKDIEATNAGPPSVELVAAIAAASSESAVGTQPSAIDGGAASGG